MQAAELQGQVGSYESFTELCIQELRRLSMLAGEPFQLPALPPPAQVLLAACAERALHLSCASQHDLGASWLPVMTMEGHAALMMRGFAGIWHVAHINASFHSTLAIKQAN